MIVRNILTDLCRRYCLKKMSQKGFPTDFSAMKAQYKYKQNLFAEEIICKEPFKQFKIWYDEASTCPSILDARAMCLTTCTRSGIPSARFVILREYSKQGFKFFTNYNSRKGKELKDNPNAALVFYWEPLRRSIRLEGTVNKLSEKESTEFFYSRPKEYQIDAAVSNQSEPVCNRDILSERLKEFASSKCIPKPEHWGGYILKPHSFEFLQGCSAGVHDRIHFRIAAETDNVDNILLHEGENNWVYERLWP